MSTNTSSICAKCIIVSAGVELFVRSLISVATLALSTWRTCSIAVIADLMRVHLAHKLYRLA
jgi:hypothetical protein